VNTPKETHKTILRTSPTAFWRVDAQGLIVEVNAAACKFSGYTEQELLRMHVYEIDATDDETVVKSRMKKMVESGEVLHFETKHRRKDGSLYDVTTSAKHADNGQFVCFFEDITDRKRFERELRESNEMFSVFMQHTPAYVYIKKVTPTESITLRASDNFQQMTGKTMSEIIGKPLPEVFPADFAAKMTAEDWAECIQVGKVVSILTKRLKQICGGGYSIDRNYGYV
jgi:PAS domain S-box-containing protein